MPKSIRRGRSPRLNALLRYSILDTAAEQAYDDITRIAAFITQSPIALISLVDRDRQWFKSRIGMAASETPREMSFCSHAIEKPSSLFVIPDALADERFSENPLVTGNPKIRFYCGAPLVTAENHALGTLCVIDNVPRQLTNEQTEMLQALSRQVMVLLELRLYSENLFNATENQRALLTQMESYQRELTSAYGELKQENLTDGLTGVGTRAAFDARLEQEIQQSTRFESKLSLLLIDVDNFKDLNDSFGHAAGDAALKLIAQALGCLRLGDFLFRFGGDEFAVIAPTTDREGAEELGKRLRKAVAYLAYPNRSVTISVGVATAIAGSASSLFAEADRALYAAKRKGANCVVHSKDLRDAVALEAANVSFLNPLARTG